MVLWAVLGCADVGDGSARAKNQKDHSASEDSASEDSASDARDIDVLIVGAGVAGLAAAIEAADGGASIMLLEREEQAGGAALLAGGLMMFSGTPEQAAMGIVDSPEQLLSEWASFTGGNPDDAWVQYFVAHNVDLVHDWLAAKGGVWSGITADPSSGTTQRVHQFDTHGEGLAALLLDEVPSSNIRTHAEAVDLIQDADGEIIGVTWTDLDDGSAHSTTAGAVILATGGFMHNLSRIQGVRPDLTDYDVRPSAFSGSDGNGLTLLERYGAATRNLAALGLYAHAAPHPTDPEGEVEVPFMQGVPWVNAESSRFVDEFTTTSLITGSVRASQPEGAAWMIASGGTVGEGHFTDAEDAGTVFTMKDMLDAHVGALAEDLPSLATMIGVGPDELSQVVTDWNEVAAGRAADAFRSPDHPCAAMERGPWIALPVAISAAKNFGGIDVDLSGRVLGTDGNVLPGVYAAGELTGMAGGSLVGEYGFTGSLSAVVLSGRVAGAAAAEAALSEE